MENYIQDGVVEPDRMNHAIRVSQQIALRCGSNTGQWEQAR